MISHEDKFNLDSVDFWHYMENVADSHGIGDDPDAASDYICSLGDEVLQHHWEQFLLTL